jgi:hypothetical protein
MSAGSTPFLLDIRLQALLELLLQISESLLGITLDLCILSLCLSSQLMSLTLGLSSEVICLFN